MMKGMPLGIPVVSVGVLRYGVLGCAMGAECNAIALRPDSRARFVMPDARTISLRRPPVVVAVEGRFVPPDVELREVDARWSALCAENSKYFDGSMLQVLGVSRNGHGGVQVHVQACSYRFYAVQLSRANRPGLACGVRPIGVKGIVRDHDKVLIGRRARSVASYPGAWEFVPGGMLEPNERPEDAVLRELREEASLAPVTPPCAIALIFDEVASTWEIVYRIQLQLNGLPEPRWEYDEYRLVTRDELDACATLSPCAVQIAAFAWR